MNRFLFLLGFFFIQFAAIAQKQVVDSMDRILAKEKIDSNRVTLMWKIADAVNKYDPERALSLSREGLFLAKKIKYKEGQSRSLGILANTFINLGNYPKALEFNFEKLKLEEKGKNPRSLASVYMNIAIVYVFQEEYHQALFYYSKSDSVINSNNVEEFKYNIALNLGDVYDRLNMTDSAYNYFLKSLSIANKLKDGYLIGASLTGLGHSYLKKEQYQLALSNYELGISYLKAADDEELLCEATLGLATLFKKINVEDSAVYYATISKRIAEKDGFQPRQLNAANFLATHYKETKDIDSAFFYLNYVKLLNDSINSKDRIRESQILSSNEQLRQLEIEENKRIAQQERKQQLQLLFIGIFIPGFFLVTLLLSRVKIHIRAVKILGVLSLLIFFEYLTLLLHPYVAELTHHTPVIEMFIFVSMAAILIPTHHRIEHWMIQKLINQRLPYSDSNIKLKTIRIKKKSS